MIKNILIGAGGLFLVLVVVLVITSRSRDSMVSQTEPQFDQPVVLGTSKENEILTPTPTLTPITKPVSKPSPPTYQQPAVKVLTAYKYGERASLKDGRYITVFNPIVGYKPEGSYPEAQQGKKYIIAETLYENMGNKKTMCYVTLRLGDTKEFFFDHYDEVKQPGLNGSCRSMEDQAYLQPGKDMRGFVTFQVNEDTVVQKIVYQDYEHGEKVTFSDN